MWGLLFPLRRACGAGESADAENGVKCLVGADAHISPQICAFTVKRVRVDLGIDPYGAFHYL